MALGLSQPRFGLLLGISQAHVSRIESGGSYSRSIDILLDRIATDNGLHDLVVSPSGSSSLSPGSPASVRTDEAVNGGDLSPEAAA